MNKVVLIILILFSAKVFSQKNIRALSLNDCLELAVENSHKLNGSKIAISQTDGEIELSKLNRIPNLVFTTYYSFLWGTNFNLVTNERSPFQTQNSAQTVQIQAPLYLNGQKKIITEKARNGKLYFESQYKEERFQLSLNLVSLYYKELFYKDYTDIIEKLLQVSKQQFINSQIKYNAGSISKDELALSNSSYLEDLEKFSENKIALEFANNQLKEFIGVKKSLDSIVFITDTAKKSRQILPDEAGISEILNSNNSLISQDKVIANAILDLKMAKQKPYPQLYLVGIIASDYDKASSVYFGNFGEQFKTNLGYSIQLATGFSLSNVINSKKLNQRYSLEIEKLKQTKSEMQKDLKITIDNIIFSIKTLREKSNNLYNLLNNYELIYNMCSEKLQYGKISQLEFLQLKNKYINFSASYLTSKYELMLNTQILDNYLTLQTQKEI
jgi:outer membrane protein